MDILTAAVQVSVILTALGGLFAFAVLRPLQAAINDLRALVNEIRGELKSNNVRVSGIEGELRELKYSVQKAHDRIDVALEERARHAN